MGFAATQRLGVYEVVAPLGRGGMGEVWRATDSRLGREVALKLLPVELASDPERLARLEREARLLASLNHPNIAHLYAFETLACADGTRAHALVMELVPGEDLADRLARGRVPLQEALAIACQVAEALEEAHEHGVVHRDLKPANVKLTPDGRVKVLDFGLAKAWAGEAAATSGNGPVLSQSPTLARTGTLSGVILGTAAYMSPEQARGRAVDRRADIWSFGVLLYEMLTGRRLFEGETVTDVLASVVKDPVDWSALPADTPPWLRRLLERCLERDPKLRLRDIGEARIALAAPAATASRESSGPARRGGRRLLAVAAVVLLAAAAALALALPRLRPRDAVPVRFTVELGGRERLQSVTNSGYHGAHAVLSPDGRTIAFLTDDAKERRMYVRRLDRLEPLPLDGTGDAQTPAFSPDGRWIAFATARALMKVGVDGGAPVKLCDVVGDFGRGLAWSEQGTIVFSPGFDTALVRLPAAGGAPEPLTRIDAARQERSHRWPWFLPDGRHVLFVVQHGGQDYDDADIEAVSLADGRRTLLVHGGSFPRYAPPGRLLFVRGTTLYAVRFDPDRLRVEQPATPVLQDLLTWMGDQESVDGSAEYAVSATGTLLYRRSAGRVAGQGSSLVWIDGAGHEAAAFEEPLRVIGVEISPDGGRVALDARSARGAGIWIRDLARGSATPLTTDGAGERHPVWFPDGHRLAFASAATGYLAIHLRSLDGSTPETVLTRLPVSASPTTVTPDGKALLFELRAPAGGDIERVETAGGGPARPLVATPATEGGARVSPNGRWVAYYGEEKGAGQVFVTPLAGGPHWQVSTRDDSDQPRWSRDGSHLFFVEDGATLVSVPVEDRGGEPRFGRPRVVYRGLLRSAHGQPCYDLGADGRILLVKREGAPPAVDWSKAVLVLGWQTELERLTGPGA